MILIVGCGFLGQYILQALSEFTDEPVVATYREHKNDAVFGGKNVRWVQYDAADAAAPARLRQICGGEARTVFYLASCHNIDFVFRNPQIAYQTNITGLQAFLEGFPDVETLLYASTDCVYGEGAGRDGGFRETDPTDPVNTYGKQKQAAERLVLRAGHHAARLPYMLGPSLSSHKNFYDRIADELTRSRPVFLADGLERSVLSYRQVSRLLVRLADHKELPPIVNLADDRGFTKYEMGRCIAKRLNCPDRLVQKMSAQDVNALFADRRAASARMDNRLLKSVLNIACLEWECALC